MTAIKSFLKFATFFLALPLAFGISIHLPATLRAMSQPPSSQGLPNTWGAYEPDPNIGKPGRREGGGTRGPCVKNSANYQLTSLVPANSFGTTLAEYPTFFVYVPTIQEEEKPQLEFALKTENDRVIYKTNFTIARSPGVVSVSLPASANLPRLEENKNYKWSFTLICNPEDPSDRSSNSQVEGSIRRVRLSPTIVQQLEGVALPRDRVVAYSTAGIWFDALSTLAELRRATPSDPTLEKDWKNLLQSVGLETIASEPLLQPVAASDRKNPNISSNE